MNPALEKPLSVNVAVVGIDEYEFLSHLSACVSDAEGWRTCFSTYGGCTVFNPIVDVFATKEEILGQLGYWASRVKPGDAFFYAHSGHGDVDVLCSYRSSHEYTSEDITASEFASKMMEFPKGVGMVVILDTCNSGSIPSVTRRAQSRKLLSVSSSTTKRSFAESVLSVMNAKPKRLLSASPSLDETGYPKITSGDEIGWLTAVDPIQYSIDGAYSRDCLQTAGWKFGGADYDRGGTIDFRELGEFATYWFGRKFDEYGMTPQMFSPDILSATCAGRVPSPDVYHRVSSSGSISATTDEAYRVTVNWSAVEGAERYTIACITNNVTNFYHTTETRKTFRDLRPGTVLSVYVKAENKMDVGLPSEIIVGVATNNVDVENRVARYDWSSIDTNSANPINSNGTIDYDKLYIDHDGDGMTSFQECIAGTDPLNDKSKFVAKISIKANGEPEVSWEPNTPELRATRVYRTLGKANLTDADWIDITDKDQSAYRFFKVTVDLP